MASGEKSAKLYTILRKKSISEDEYRFLDNYSLSSIIKEAPDEKISGLYSSVVRFLPNSVNNLSELNRQREVLYNTGTIDFLSEKFRFCYNALK